MFSKNFQCCWIAFVRWLCGSVNTFCKFHSWKPGLSMGSQLDQHLGCFLTSYPKHHILFKTLGYTVNSFTSWHGPPNWHRTHHSLHFFFSRCLRQNPVGVNQRKWFYPRHFLLNISLYLRFFLERSVFFATRPFASICKQKPSHLSAKQALYWWLSFFLFFCLILSDTC